MRTLKKKVETTNTTHIEYAEVTKQIEQSGRKKERERKRERGGASGSRTPYGIH